MSVRDGSTNWDLEYYLDANYTVVQLEGLSSAVSKYDPRCRTWFNASLEYIFSEDIDAADAVFRGLDTLRSFYFPDEASGDAPYIESCEAQNWYLDI